jgi:hypothetical protein
MFIMPNLSVGIKILLGELNEKNTFARSILKM